MKKIIVVMLAVFLLLPAMNAAMAAGEPPKNVLKGFFVKVDAKNRQATFKIDGSEEIKTLTFGKEVSVEDIRLDKKLLVSLDPNAAPNTVKEISIMFMDMTLSRIAALIIIGLIGGLLSGFIGSGGAFVMTPAMMTLGAAGAIAVASNICHKFPKAMVGAFKRYKYGQVDIKLGIVMAVTAIIGMDIGIRIQRFVLNHWGNAGSNLYVSTVYVVVLLLVGGYVTKDAYNLSKGGGEVKTTKLALSLQKVNLWPMMEFKVAKVKISAWLTIPIGILTGMLASAIGVGGFIGVPGMIYIIGASALVASATELVIAFIMGFYGAVQWGIYGLIDIRMTLLILLGSLFGVQLGALGTTYVKDYMIKVVMAAVMLIVAVSRGSKIPGYLADLDVIPQLSDSLSFGLGQISFWALVLALAVAGVIITVAMAKGMIESRREERSMAVGQN